jgi:acetyl esterase
MIHLTRRQRLEARLARALLALPAALLSRLAGAPISRDGFTLDPQAQLILALQRRLKKPASHQLSLAQARANLRVEAATLAAAPRRDVDAEDRAFDGPGGPLKLRIYRPRHVPAPAPALLYYHGGGFVLGDLDSHDDVCQVLAEDAGIVVIAVDYRLAPEHPFPAAVDDALAALRYVHGHAAELGLDPSRLAVGGDSAGGNLAAVVALATRRQPVRPSFQLLIYPAVDLTMSFPSITSLGEGFFLERATIEWFVERYVPDPQQRRDPRASPYFCDDLAGAPPAFILTLGFDPLRDEGDAYARRLEEAGVLTTHRCYGDMFHGFLNTSGAILRGAAALAELAAALRRALVQR